jgi:hypothetical protein
LRDEVSKEVLVRSNDPKNPNFVLTFEAEIVDGQTDQKENDNVISETKNIVTESLQHENLFYFFDQK